VESPAARLIVVSTAAGTREFVHANILARAHRWPEQAPRDRLPLATRVASQSAREAAAAEQQELADKATLTGAKIGRSVELVVMGRSAAVKNAMHVALYGRTTAEIDAANTANRAKWAEMDQRAQARITVHIESHKTCTKCHAAKSGYCNDHRDLRPSQGGAYTPSVGANYFDSGYRDGYEADLGSKPGSELGGSRTAMR
jgi:hypothetical protein